MVRSSMTDSVALAKAFAQLVSETVGQDLTEINRRNRTEERFDCASTDFCNAAALMNRAWREVISGTLPKRRGRLIASEAALWNEAWQLAAIAGFDAQKIRDPKR